MTEKQNQKGRERRKPKTDKQILKEFNATIEKLLKAGEEEFRIGMVAHLQCVMETFFMAVKGCVDFSSQSRKDIDAAIKANNKDFAIAEKNFKTVGGRLDVLEESMIVLLNYTIPDLQGRKMPVKSKRFFCKLLGVDYTHFTEKLRKAISLLEA